MCSTGQYDSAVAMYSTRTPNESNYSNIKYCYSRRLTTMSCEVSQSALVDRKNESCIRSFRSTWLQHDTRTVLVTYDRYNCSTVDLPMNTIAVAVVIAVAIVSVSTKYKY